MYLVDTNVWLEVLLEQQRADEVAGLFRRVAPGQLFISDFALHSMAVILTRLKRPEALRRFVQDVVVDSGVQVVPRS